MSGCSEQKAEPADTDEKTVKEITVHMSEDKLVIPEYELAEDEVAKFVTEDGKEVKIDLADGLTNGSYEMEVTYVEDGKDVTENMVVILGEEPSTDNPSADEPTSSATDKASLSWGDPGYGDVEINGVVYGFNDLNDMDWDTSIAWAEAVYSNKRGYEVVPGGDSQLIAINIYEGMPCEEMVVLARGLRGGKGWISVNANENAKVDAVATACGL